MSTETPLDLKKTVNLPKTGFSQKAKLSQSEPVRLKKWTEMRLYELIRGARTGAEKFILHDGPPYANADIHLGTAMNKILKDFIVKSRTMLGYDAPYVPGYDCHGLPIELYVDRKLGAKKAQMPATSIRRACREHAAEALKRQTRDFQRLGILGEWDNPYLTMSNEYEAETARQFARFIERGYVYRGARPVYWCIHDQTALAEAEVEYHQHTSPSVYVKFPLKSNPALIDPALAGRKVFVLIWTTTPWTLPANLGITVHPDFQYSAFENGDEVYIVASELLDAVVEKCGLVQSDDGRDSGKVKVLARFPGAKLDRLGCRHAWINRSSLLMVGEHVTLGGEADAETELDVKDAREKQSSSKAGTGAVHTAPGHGHDDFVIGKRYGLEIYCPVDHAGHFTPEVEHFAGQSVFEANAKILEFMRERGVLLFTESFSHRYPHCWRCKNPVIFRATPQWFISMDRAVGAVVETVEKDEDGRDRSNFTENFSEGETSLRAAALREIENVKWFPAWGKVRMGNMLKGRPDWCVSRQRVWGVSIPVFYCAKCSEAVAEPAVINHVADIFERESSDAWYIKEARELLPDGYVCKQCGATEWTKETDILDVWFDSGSSSVAVLENRAELRWPADVYLEGGDQFRGWFNSSLMVGIAAHDHAPYKAVITHGWTVDAQGKEMHKSGGNAVPPDEVIKESGADIYEFHTAYHALYRFCTVTLSARYFDILKDRLYTFAPRHPARRAAQTALARIADGLARMLAPLLVFTADEIWENLPADSARPQSVHLAVFPEAEGVVDEQLAANWKRLFEIREDVLQTLEEARIAKVIGSSLDARVEIAATGASYDLLDRYRDELRYIFIVSQVEVTRSDEGADGFVVKVLPAEGGKCERCWNYSTRVGESEKYPGVCERCVAALAEIEQEAAS